jgi:hypothetical protein
MELEPALQLFVAVEDLSDVWDFVQKARRPPTPLPPGPPPPPHAAAAARAGV